MELNLGINGANNKTNEIEEFTKELNNALQEDEILIYKGYDSRKFTNANEEKIWDKREELIGEYINENNINGADEELIRIFLNDVLEYEKAERNLNDRKSR